MAELRFDGRVVVVTGAGGGLGRSYALLFASRGAKVVVNDLGGSSNGEGQSSKAADNVVNEIIAAGGEAVANYDSVEDGEKIIQTALDKWGKVDILINNAGILRDRSFVKMTDADWELIFKVHVFGSYKCAKAAWPSMRQNGYGRIINTASAAGLYGNFGQTNYSAAKLGLLGFSNSLAIEGQPKNILTNTIAPIAGSRMTEGILPPEVHAALKPEHVAPLVAYLCHESSDVNGQVFEVGAGFCAAVRIQRTKGAYTNPDKGYTPENVRDSWSTITDFSKDAVSPKSSSEAVGDVLSAINDLSPKL